MPMSVGVDGAVYGVTAGAIDNRAIRSSDGFATTDDGPTFAGRAIIHATRFAERYVVVTAERWAAHSVMEEWRVHVCDTWDPDPDAWDVTATGPTLLNHRLSFGQPATRNGGTLWMLWEYSGGNEHRRFLITEDGGGTWRELTSNTDLGTRGAAGVNAHCHAAAWDPGTDRIFVSVGDGANSGLFFFEGPDWSSPLPADRALQPTAIVPMPAGIITGPDAGYAWAPGAHVGWVDPFRPTDGNYRVQAEVPGSTISPSNQFPTMRYAGDGVETCYLIFPPYPEHQATVPLVIMATGDGGYTWHPVYSEMQGGPEGSGAWWESSIIGPDSGGRIFCYGLDANEAPVLRIAQAPTWTDDT